MFIGRERELASLKEFYEKDRIGGWGCFAAYIGFTLWMRQKTTLTSRSIISWKSIMNIWQSAVFPWISCRRIRRILGYKFVRAIHSGWLLFIKIECSQCIFFIQINFNKINLNKWVLQGWCRWVYIVCGASYPGGRLAAICLDTGEEYYSAPAVI